MTIRERIRSAVKGGINRGVKPYGYRLINPSHRFGIDPIADVTRLAGLWGIDLATVFDVGANVGASTRAYRAAWPASRVIAFEPNGVVAAELRTGTAALGGVRVEEVALSAEPGRAEFFIHETQTSLSSLKPFSPFAKRFGHEGKPVSVPVTTLDAYCAENAIAHVNLLKIDAEGSDHDVLRGSARMLAGKHVDFVYCEFNSLSPSPDAFGSLMPIAALLGTRGYNFIASYNDYILTEGAFFAVSNALFAADRGLP